MVTIVGTPNGNLQNMAAAFAACIRILHCPTQKVPVHNF